MASPSWHYVLKFIITGDAAVGKSSLLVRLTDQRFLANPDPTLGVEFGSKLISLPPLPPAPADEPPTIVKLQCWDTAGTESFRSITRSYYRGAAGCLLVYDVTSRRSFENIRGWLADLHIGGNKVDLCDDGADPARRQVPTAEAAQFAAEEGLLFAEASAKRGTAKGGKFDDERSPGVKLSTPGSATAPASAERPCCA
ncbi:P-loop containing nucleoside triphosphate hydrolase protein [Mycena sp. CBHHK59/15]|nr:P-loop containing nucleoside triphosphate hydrolase protein [Mycena sp. CBHHK59/15]